VRHAPSLWAEENLLLGPPSPLRAWELNDAFTEGMTLLQGYPLKSAGGIDSILQTAVELRRRREDESKALNSNTTLGSRLRDTFWKGITNQNISPLSSPEMSDKSDEEPHEDGDETETPSVDASSSAPGLASRLANVVWQGITNQSAMEAPPSPVSPLPSSSASPLLPSSPASPLPPPSPLSPDSPKSSTSSVSSAPSSWWNYAEKIKESDAAASLSKVSTNWRVKALQAWNKTSAPPSPSASDASQSHVRHGTDPASRTSSEGSVAAHRERSSSDAFHSETYSPPPRPAFFRPPRDSMLPQPRRSAWPPSPTPPDSGADTPSAQVKGLRDSLVSLAGLAAAAPSKPSPKSGPKPLLLNSSSLVSPTSSVLVRTPPPHLRGDSQSSITTSAPDIVKKTRRHDSHSEWESDAIESRIIPLNRRSVSPMAPQFHTARGRPQSSSSDKGLNGQDLFLSRELNSPSGRSDGSASRGWSRVDRLDSPATLPASPPLFTPPPPISASSHSAVSGVNSQRGSLVITEPNIRVLEAPIQARKLVRKKTPPPSHVDYTSDSSVARDALPRSPRLRPKRAAHNLATIHIQKDKSTEDSGISNTLTLPEFLDDHDNAVTPRATAFHQLDENSTSSPSPSSPAPPPIRARKLSSEGRKAHGDTSEPRTRKISSSSHSPRTRKISEGRSAKRDDSAAEEGDDEGYDELLSAYESEDSIAHGAQH
jgi:hypothetical protein